MNQRITDLKQAHLWTSTATILVFVFVMMLLGVTDVNAQGTSDKVTVYETFVYTSDQLANDISKLNDERDSSRGYLGDLFAATTGSMKGIASGYVTSFIDLGVSAIGALVTRNARHKKEWEEAVKKENVYQTVINSVSEMIFMTPRHSMVPWTPRECGLMASVVSGKMAATLLSTYPAISTEANCIVSSTIQNLNWCWTPSFSVPHIPTSQTPN